MGVKSPAAKLWEVIISVNISWRYRKGGFERSLGVSGGLLRNRERMSIVFWIAESRSAASILQNLFELF